MDGDSINPTVGLEDSGVEKLAHDGQPIYSLGNQRPIAHCCLVANSGENTNKPLHFTSNDLEHVAVTFKRIHAIIVHQQRYKGMELQDVENLLNKLKTLDLRDCPCFIFYYSGHGKDCGIQLDENTTYHFHKIIDVIASLPDLEGKPKVFIFDCCRVFPNEPANYGPCKAEAYTDCIIAFACSSGEVAFMSNLPYTTANSSIFTKVFCSTLMSKHCQWPLVSILIHANSLTRKSMREYLVQARSVADNRESLSTQTPQVMVKLQKQLYLCCELLS